jgi:hypothetical protein
VDEEHQAAMLINGWFDAAALGISRVYIYQLMDGQPDEAAPNQENHFGLFRLDGSPKPAATAFRTLNELLADNGPQARTFAPPPAPARVALERPLACLTLQAATGTSFLALWNESPAWDPQTAAPAPVAPAVARVTLPRPRPLTAFDIVDRGRIQALGTTASAEIAVGVHPVVVRLG